MDNLTQYKTNEYVIYDEMLNAGVAVSLPTPVLTNFMGILLMNQKALCGSNPSK